MHRLNQLYTVTLTEPEVRGDASPKSANTVILELLSVHSICCPKLAISKLGCAYVQRFMNRSTSSGSTDQYQKSIGMIVWKNH